MLQGLEPVRAKPSADDPVNRSAGSGSKAAARAAEKAVRKPPGEADGRVPCPPPDFRDLFCVSFLLKFQRFARFYIDKSIP